MSTRGESSTAPRPVRTYHYRVGGLVYLIVTMFLAVGAVNSQNNLLFWALGLAVAGVVLSGVVSAGSLMSLSVRRRAPVICPAGEPVTLSYELTNHSRLFPSVAVVVTELGPRGRKRDWPGVLAGAPAALGQLVPRRSSRVVRAPLMASRRGVAQLARLRAETTFPFGIASKSVTVEAPAEIVFSPRVHPLRREVADALASLAESGQRARRTLGHAGEFFALREYAPGDPVRTIAWKASARTGELRVRQLTHPASRSVTVLLSLPSEPADAELEERAIELSASVVSHVARLGAPVGLLVPALGIDDAPSAGPSRASQLLETLARLDLDAPREPFAVESAPALADVLVLPGVVCPMGHMIVLGGADMDSAVLAAATPRARGGGP